MLIFFLKTPTITVIVTLIFLCILIFSYIWNTNNLPIHSLTTFYSTTFITKDPLSALMTDIL